VTAHDRFPTYVEDQRAFFDRLVTDEWSSYLDPAWAAERRYEIRMLLRRVQPTTVLNVGCGAGFHDLDLAAHVGHVVGIDTSVQSVACAERHNPHPRVERHVADVLRYQVGEPFDLVVSFQVLEHLPRPEAFLAACARLGRHVAVFTPNPARLSNRLRRLARTPTKLEDPQHFAEYTTAQIDELCIAAGLRPFASFGYGMNVSWRGHRLLPPVLGRSLGRFLPALAYRHAVLARRADA
jgi:2-polyprenyl-3-methyl-5-hydroxy-6-metoxy-1,4-benzoquinol methylase